MSGLGNININDALALVAGNKKHNERIFKTVDDPMLEELARKFAGNKKLEQDQMRYLLAKKRQYELTKAYFDENSKIRGNDDFMIAPVFDDKGGFEYDWVPASEYWSTGQMRKFMQNRKNMYPAPGFYFSPRDMVQGIAAGMNVPYDDNYLYNASDDVWNTPFESPWVRAGTEFIKGGLPKHLQKTVTDDVLRDRRKAGAKTDDATQAGLEATAMYALPAIIGSAMATGGMSLPVGLGALAVGMGGTAGLNSLIDDLRMPDPIKPDSSWLDWSYIDQSAPFTGAQLTGLNEGIYEPASKEEVALEGGIGALLGLLPAWLIKHGSTGRGVLHDLKVMSNFGDDPVARKELIYNTLQNAANKGDTQASTMLKQLAEEGVTTGAQLPDRFMERVDQIMQGPMNYGDFRHLPYESRGLNEGNIVGTMPPLKTGGADLEALARETDFIKGARERAVNNANEGLVRSGNRADEQFRNTVQGLDDNLLPRLQELDEFGRLGEGDEFLNSVTETAKRGAIQERNAGVASAEGARAEGRATAREHRNELVGNANQRARQAMNSTFAQLEGENPAVLNQPNLQLMARRLVELNPERFGLNRLYGPQDAERAAEALLTEALTRPDSEMSQMFLANLTQKPLNARKIANWGTDWQEHLPPVPENKPFGSRGFSLDRSSEVGAKLPEAQKHVMSAKHATWTKDGVDVTDLYKAADKEHSEIKAMKPAFGVNPREYTSYMRKGSFDPSKARAEQTALGETLHGAVGRKAYKAVKNSMLAAAPFADVGAALVARKLSPYAVDFLPELPRKKKDNGDDK